MTVVNLYSSTNSPTYFTRSVVYRYPKEQRACHDTSGTEAFARTDCEKTKLRQIGESTLAYVRKSSKPRRIIKQCCIRLTSRARMTSIYYGTIYDRAVKFSLYGTLLGKVCAYNRVSFCHTLPFVLENIRFIKFTILYASYKNVDATTHYLLTTPSSAIR